MPKYTPENDPLKNSPDNNKLKEFTANVYSYLTKDFGYDDNYANFYNTFVKDKNFRDTIYNETGGTAVYGDKTLFDTKVDDILTGKAHGYQLPEVQVIGPKPGATPVEIINPKTGEKTFGYEPESVQFLKSKGVWYHQPAPKLEDADKEINSRLIREDNPLPIAKVFENYPIMYDGKLNRNFKEIERIYYARNNEEFLKANDMISNFERNYYNKLKEAEIARKEASIIKDETEHGSGLLGTGLFFRNFFPSVYRGIQDNLSLLSGVPVEQMFNINPRIDKDKALDLYQRGYINKKTYDTYADRESSISWIQDIISNTTNSALIMGELMLTRGESGVELATSQGMKFLSKQWLKDTIGKKGLQYYAKSLMHGFQESGNLFFYGGQMRALQNINEKSMNGELGWKDFILEPLKEYAKGGMEGMSEEFLGGELKMGGNWYKDVLKRLIIGSPLEATTEDMGQAFNDIVDGTNTSILAGIFKEEGISKDAVRQFIISAAVGGILGAGGSGVASIRRMQTENLINKRGGELLLQYLSENKQRILGNTFNKLVERSDFVQGIINSQSVDSGFAKELLAITHEGVKTTENEQTNDHYNLLTNDIANEIKEEHGVNLNETDKLLIKGVLSLHDQMFKADPSILPTERNKEQLIDSIINDGVLGVKWNTLNNITNSLEGFTPGMKGQMLTKLFKGEIDEKQEGNKLLLDSFYKGLMLTGEQIRHHSEYTRRITQPDNVTINTDDISIPSNEAEGFRMQKGDKILLKLFNTPGISLLIKEEARGILRARGFKVKSYLEEKAELTTPVVSPINDNLDIQDKELQKELESKSKDKLSPEEKATKSALLVASQQEPVAIKEELIDPTDANATRDYLKDVDNEEIGNEGGGIAIGTPEDVAVVTPKDLEGVTDIEPSINDLYNRAIKQDEVKKEVENTGIPFKTPVEYKGRIGYFITDIQGDIIFKGSKGEFEKVTLEELQNEKENITFSTKEDLKFAEENQVDLSSYTDINNNNYINRNFSSTEIYELRQLMRSIKIAGNPLTRLAMKWINGRLGDIPVRFIRSTQDAYKYLYDEQNDDFYYASYKGGTIYINASIPFTIIDLQKLLLHEGMHALTVNLLKTSPEFDKEIGEVLSTLKKYVEKQKLNVAQIYGISSNAEFIANLYSGTISVDGEFISIPKLMNRIIDGKITLWERVKNMFRKVFTEEDESLQAILDKVLIKHLDKMGEGTLDDIYGSVPIYKGKVLATNMASGKYEIIPYKENRPEIADYVVYVEKHIPEYYQTNLGGPRQKNIVEENIKTFFDPTRETLEDTIEKIKKDKALSNYSIKYTPAGGGPTSYLHESKSKTKLNPKVNENIQRRLDGKKISIGDIWEESQQEVNESLTTSFDNDRDLKDDEYDYEDYMEGYEYTMLTGERAFAEALAEIYPNKEIGKDYRGFLRQFKFTEFLGIVQLVKDSIQSKGTELGHKFTKLLLKEYELTGHNEICSFEDFVERKLTYTWNRIQSIQKFNHINVTLIEDKTENNGYVEYNKVGMSIKELGINFYGNNGAIQSAYRHKVELQRMLPRIAQLLDISPEDLEIVFINGFDKSLNPGKLYSFQDVSWSGKLGNLSMKDLTLYLFGKGYISLNVLGEKNTMPLIKLKTKSLSTKGVEQVEKLYNFYKKLWDENSSPEDKVIDFKDTIITLKICTVIRAFIEDLKINPRNANFSTTTGNVNNDINSGGKTWETVVNGDTALLSEREVLDSTGNKVIKRSLRPFTDLMKRQIIGKDLWYIEQGIERLKQINPELKVSDSKYPIDEPFFIDSTTGKLMMRVVFIDDTTMATNKDSFVKEANKPESDGSIFVPLGKNHFGDYFRRLLGVSYPGGFKTWGYPFLNYFGKHANVVPIKNNLYLKSLIHELSEEDTLTKVMMANKIGMIVPLQQDKLKGLDAKNLVTYEELTGGDTTKTTDFSMNPAIKDRIYHIPIDSFNYIKMVHETDVSTRGFMQFMFTKQLTKNNPLIPQNIELDRKGDPISIDRIFNTVTNVVQNLADKLLINVKKTNREYSIIQRVLDNLEVNATSQQQRMLYNFLEPYIELRDKGIIDEQTIRNTIMGLLDNPEVAKYLNDQLNRKLTGTFKAELKGAMPTLSPDLGNLRTSGIKALQDDTHILPMFWSNITSEILKKKNVRGIELNEQDSQLVHDILNQHKNEIDLFVRYNTLKKDIRRLEKLLLTKEFDNNQLTDEELKAIGEKLQEYKNFRKSIKGKIAKDSWQFMKNEKFMDFYTNKWKPKYLSNVMDKETGHLINQHCIIPSSIANNLNVAVGDKVILTITPSINASQTFVVTVAGIINDDNGYREGVKRYGDISTASLIIDRILAQSHGRDFDADVLSMAVYDEDIFGSKHNWEMFCKTLEDMQESYIRKAYKVFYQKANDGSLPTYNDLINLKDPKTGKKIGNPYYALGLMQSPKYSALYCQSILGKETVTPGMNAFIGEAAISLGDKYRKPIGFITQIQKWFTLYNAIGLSLKFKGKEYGAIKSKLNVPAEVRMNSDDYKFVLMSNLFSFMSNHRLDFPNDDSMLTYKNDDGQLTRLSMNGEVEFDNTGDYMRVEKVLKFLFEDGLNLLDERNFSKEAKTFEDNLVLLKRQKIILECLQNIYNKSVSETLSKQEINDWIIKLKEILVEKVEEVNNDNFIKAKKRLTGTYAEKQTMIESIEKLFSQKAKDDLTSIYNILGLHSKNSTLIQGLFQIEDIYSYPLFELIRNIDVNRLENSKFGWHEYFNRSIELSIANDINENNVSVYLDKKPIEPIKEEINEAKEVLDNNISDDMINYITNQINKNKIPIPDTNVKPLSEADINTIQSQAEDLFGIAFTKEEVKEVYEQTEKEKIDERYPNYVIEETAVLDNCKDLDARASQMIKKLFDEINANNKHAGVLAVTLSHLIKGTDVIENTKQRDIPVVYPDYYDAKDTGTLISAISFALMSKMLATQSLFDFSYHIKNSKIPSISGRTYNDYRNNIRDTTRKLAEHTVELLTDGNDVLYLLANNEDNIIPFYYKGSEYLKKSDQELSKKFIGAYINLAYKKFKDDNMVNFTRNAEGKLNPTAQRVYDDAVKLYMEIVQGTIWKPVGKDIPRAVYNRNIHKAGLVAVISDYLESLTSSPNKEFIPLNQYDKNTPVYELFAGRRNVFTNNELLSNYDENIAESWFAQGLNVGMHNRLVLSQFLDMTSKYNVNLTNRIRIANAWINKLLAEEIISKEDLVRIFNMFMVTPGRIMYPSEGGSMPGSIKLSGKTLIKDSMIDLDRMSLEEQSNFDVKKNRYSYNSVLLELMRKHTPHLANAYLERYADFSMDIKESGDLETYGAFNYRGDRATINRYNRKFRHMDIDDSQRKEMRKFKEVMKKGLDHGLNYIMEFITDLNLFTYLQANEPALLEYAKYIKEFTPGIYSWETPEGRKTIPTTPKKMPKQLQKLETMNAEDFEREWNDMGDIQTSRLYGEKSTRYLIDFINQDILLLELGIAPGLSKASLDDLPSTLTTRKLYVLFSTLLRVKKGLTQQVEDKGVKHFFRKFLTANIIADRYGINRLISGKSFFYGGKEYNNKIYRILPVFSGGDNKISNFIDANSVIRYINKVLPGTYTLDTTGSMGIEHYVYEQIKAYKQGLEKAAGIHIINYHQAVNELAKLMKNKKYGNTVFGEDEAMNRIQAEALIRDFIENEMSNFEHSGNSILAKHKNRFRINMAGSMKNPINNEYVFRRIGGNSNDLVNQRQLMADLEKELRDPNNLDPDTKAPYTPDKIDFLLATFKAGLQIKLLYEFEYKQCLATIKDTLVKMAQNIERYDKGKAERIKGLALSYSALYDAIDLFNPNFNPHEARNKKMSYFGFGHIGAEEGINIDIIRNKGFFPHIWRENEFDAYFLSASLQKEFYYLKKEIDAQREDPEGRGYIRIINYDEKDPAKRLQNYYLYPREGELQLTGKVIQQILLQRVNIALQNVKSQCRIRDGFVMAGFMGKNKSLYMDLPPMNWTATGKSAFSDLFEKDLLGLYQSLDEKNTGITTEDAINFQKKFGELISQKMRSNFTIDQTHAVFLNHLSTKIKSDLTKANYYHYEAESALRGENLGTKDLVRRWYLNMLPERYLHSKLKSIDNLKKGDEVGFFTEVMAEGIVNREQVLLEKAIAEAASEGRKFDEKAWKKKRNEEREAHLDDKGRETDEYGNPIPDYIRAIVPRYVYQWGIFEGYVNKPYRDSPIFSDGSRNPFSNATIKQGRYLQFRDYNGNIIEVLDSKIYSYDEEAPADGSKYRKSTFVNEYKETGLYEGIVNQVRKHGLMNNHIRQYAYTMLKDILAIPRFMSDVASYMYFGLFMQFYGGLKNLIGGFGASIMGNPKRYLRYLSDYRNVYKPKVEALKDAEAIALRNALDQAGLSPSSQDGMVNLMMQNDIDLDFNVMNFTGSEITNLRLLWKLRQDKTGYTALKEKIKKMEADVYAVNNPEEIIKRQKKVALFKALLSGYIKDVTLAENILDKDFNTIYHVPDANEPSGQKEVKHSIPYDVLKVLDILQKGERTQQDYNYLLGIDAKTAGMMFRTYLRNKFKRKAFYYFQKPERWLREITFFIAYQDAKEVFMDNPQFQKLYMQEGTAKYKELIEHAKKRIGVAQVYYGPEDRPLVATKNLSMAVTRFAQYNNYYFSQWYFRLKDLMQQVHMYGLFNLAKQSVTNPRGKKNLVLEQINRPRIDIQSGEKYDSVQEHQAVGVNAVDYLCQSLLQNIIMKSVLSVMGMGAFRTLGDPFIDSMLNVILNVAKIMQGVSGKDRDRELQLIFGEFFPMFGYFGKNLLALTSEETIGDLFFANSRQITAFKKVLNTISKGKWFKKIGPVDIFWFLGHTYATNNWLEIGARK